MTDRSPVPGDDREDTALFERVRRFVDDVGPETAKSALARLDSGAAGDRDWLAGRVLGEYRLLRRIESGGVGVVYEAEQQSIPGRRVAVKVLDRSSAAGCRLARFRREVAVIGRLDHPNIVPIFAADLESATPYFAMKLIRGKTLFDSIAAGEWHSVDAGWIAERFHDLALALHHAHDRGIVHRDVSPRNVMVEPDGTVLLVDFGLARDTSEDAHLTLSMDALGTPSTMSPEQIDRRFGAVSARTDVYGLGSTLYHCITGRPPYVGSTRHAIFQQILEGNAVAPRKLNPLVPRDLETICLKAIERDPPDRYTSARELAEDLAAFRADRPIRARRAGPFCRLGSWIRRHPSATSSAASVLLVLAALAAYFLLWQPSKRSRQLLEASAAWRIARDRASVPDHAGASDLESLERSVASAARRLAIFYPGSSRARRAVDALLELARHRESLRDGDLERARANFDAKTRILEELPASEWDRAAPIEAELASLEDRIRNAWRRCESWVQQALAAAPSDERARRYRARLAKERLVERLRNLAPYFEPDEVRFLESQLEEYDDHREHRRWLERRGRLRVECPEGPARVWLCPSHRDVEDGVDRYRDVEHDESLDLGTTPIDDDRIPEGSYLVRLCREGCVETRLPILLRRRAMQERADPREWDLTLHARSPEWIGEGFVYVPGGFSIVGERRTSVVDFAPRLTWVDDLVIMRDEMTVGDLLALRPFSPERTQEIVALNVGRSDADPLGGLEFMDALDILTCLTARDRDRRIDGRRIRYRMPRPEEFERAGRGSDGRVYPWGIVRRFEFASVFWSSLDEDRDHRLRPRGPAHRDLSPFGIRDLAGSMTEPCLPVDAIDRQGHFHVLLKGGDIFSQPSEFDLVHETFHEKDERKFTMGLRAVREPVEPVPEGPPRLRESFEKDVGDWRFGLGDGTSFRAGGTRATLERGKLTLRGYADDFSPSVRAWTPVRLPPGPFRIGATITITECDTEDDWPGGPAIGLLQSPSLPLVQFVQSLAQIRRTTPHVVIALDAESASRAAEAPTLGRPYRLELLVEESRIAGWMYPAFEPRPDEPYVTRELPEGTEIPSFHALFVETPQKLAMEIEVDDVTAESMR